MSKRDYSVVRKANQYEVVTTKLAMKQGLEIMQDGFTNVKDALEHMDSLLVEFKVFWSYESEVWREEGSIIISAVDSTAAENLFYKSNTPHRIGDEVGYLVESIEEVV